MTKKIISILFLALTITTVSAQNWLTDIDEAKIKATEQGKNILLVFSGSDWCIPCMKLEKFIWQSDEFKEFSDHFVLLKADFPKQKKNRLSAEQQAHNDKLAAKYNTQGYFPMVAILNKEGTIIGQTGYKNISPQAYIDHLIELENN